jgi:hypothetical protein
MTPAQWARALAAAERAIAANTGPDTSASVVASVWLWALRIECAAIDAETAAPDPVADVSNRATEVALVRDVAARPLGSGGYVVVGALISMCVSCLNPIKFAGTAAEWRHIEPWPDSHPATPSARRYRKVGPGDIRREDQPA